MKKFVLSLSLALWALASSATTLQAIQLLNPTGSTTGQAIVSTGASTAPAWGGVGVNGIAAIAANTVLANATGSSASPTAVSIPNCAGTSSALNYTGGTGFSCNATINAVTLGGATFAAPGPIGSVSTSSGAFSSISTPSATIGGGTINAATIGATSPSTGSFTTLAASSTVSGTGFSTYLASPPAIGGTAPAAGKFTTLQATSTITPSSTAGIVGTTTNDSANAGSVGQSICTQVSFGGTPTGCDTNTNTLVSLTSATAANVGNISLPAGDWDVCGQVMFIPAAGTTVSQVIGWISTASATLPNAGLAANPTNFLTSSGLTTGQEQVLPLTCTRFPLASTTTIFLEAYSVFGTSTMGAGGFITARRRR